MSPNVLRRNRLTFAATLATLAGALVGPLGCRAFALRHEPFTPDAPPVSEVRVAGGDTTYVVRAPAYVLVTRRRGLLWDRDALDDAAWRFRWLFDAPPPQIAVRVDTAGGTSRGPDAWEGLSTVTVTSVSSRAPARETAPGGTPVDARVAATWVQAWARAAAGPATPPPAAGVDGRLPGWFEAGAVRLVADPDARGSVARVAASARERLTLTELLAGGNATAESARPTSQLAAVGASLLLFLRERHPASLPTLAAELRAGRTLPELLRSSATLPTTLDALDAEWRRWLRRQPAPAERRAVVAP